MSSNSWKKKIENLNLKGENWKEGIETILSTFKEIVNINDKSQLNVILNLNYILAELHLVKF